MWLNLQTDRQTDKPNENQKKCKSSARIFALALQGHASRPIVEKAWPREANGARAPNSYSEICWRRLAIQCGKCWISATEGFQRKPHNYLFHLRCWRSRVEMWFKQLGRLPSAHQGQLLCLKSLSDGSLKLFASRRSLAYQLKNSLAATFLIQVCFLFQHLVYAVKFITYFGGAFKNILFIKLCLL